MWSEHSTCNRLDSNQHAETLLLQDMHHLLQDHPFMRHLQSHADYIQPLDVLSYQGGSGHQALTATSPSQPIPCAVQLLATRGSGQVIVTFWPGDSPLQQAMAAEGFRKYLTSLMPNPESKASLQGPDASLKQLLWLLGHEVVLNDQGLVDVSILPLECHVPVCHPTLATGCDKKQPGLLQRLIFKMTQQLQVPCRSTNLHTTNAVNPGTVPDTVNSTQPNISFDIQGTAGPCMSSSREESSQHQQQQEQSKCSGAFAGNPFRFAASDLALVQQWMIWDEQHNSSVVAASGDSGPDSNSGCNVGSLNNSSCLNGDALLIGSNSSTVLGTHRPLTEEAVTAAAVMTVTAAGDASTDGCWISGGPTADGTVTADAVQAAAADSLALLSRGPGEVDPVAAPGACVSNAVLCSGHLLGQQIICSTTAVTSETEARVADALLPKPLFRGSCCSIGCSSQPTTRNKVASRSSSTHTSALRTPCPQQRQASLVKDSAAESSTSQPQYNETIASDICDSCNLACSGWSSPNMPVRGHPRLDLPAGYAAGEMSAAAVAGTWGSRGPTVDELLPTAPSQASAAEICRLTTASDDQPVSEHGNSSPVLGDSKAPLAGSDLPPLVLGHVGQALRPIQQQLEQSTMGDSGQGAAQYNVLGTEVSEHTKAASTDLADVVAPDIAAASKDPGLPPAVASPEANNQKASTWHPVHQLVQTQKRVEQCYRHMIDTSKCEESPTGSFSSNLSRCSSSSPVRSSLRDPACSYLVDAPVGTGKLDSFSCRNSSIGDWQASAASPVRRILDSSSALCRPTSLSTLSRNSSQWQHTGQHLEGCLLSRQDLNKPPRPAMTACPVTLPQQRAPSIQSSSPKRRSTSPNGRYACTGEPLFDHAAAGKTASPTAAEACWYDLDYASWDSVRFEDIPGHWDWVQQEGMWQQISSKLQSISTHENRLTDLQQQQGKSQTLSQQVLLLQQQLEQEQQQLKEWLAQQRERRVEQQRLTRQQQLQEQLQDDLIIGTQGLKYPSLFGTDEISYHELQELIRQEFAARFMGDGATLAALHVPKYWVLSDAAVAELVQWVWEERLNQLLQEQRLHKAGAPEQLMLQPTVQDPLRGMLCMHHNISKGLAGVVAAHARPTAQQAIHKFLQELAQQQQADTDRFEQLRQRYADSQIDGAELAKQEYQFGVEWRYQLYRQRRLFKLYQEQQNALVPGLQQQSLEHDLALYAATKGGSRTAVQEYQRDQLLARHASSMAKQHWQDYNMLKESGGSFLRKVRCWFERATRSKRHTQFMQQQKDGIKQQERQRQKLEAVKRQQEHLSARHYAEYGLT